MAGLQIEDQPLCEPVSLVDAKNFLRVDIDDDDVLITSLIVAARELVEGFTGRSLVNKGYVQTLDSFPYFTDSVMSQQSQPAYSNYPAYSSTFWNYSQMIRLLVAGPSLCVDRVQFLSNFDSQWHSLVKATTPWQPRVNYVEGDQALDGNGNIQQATNSGKSGYNPPLAITQANGSTTPPTSGTVWSIIINGTTVDGGITWVMIGPAVNNELVASGVSTSFFADGYNEPGRIFPGAAGSYWPQVLYVPNAVKIYYRTGYGEPIPQGSPITGYLPPVGIPSRAVVAMQQLLAGWYEHRESISPLTLKDMPNHVKALLWNIRVPYYAQTRG